MQKCILEIEMDFSRVINENIWRKALLSPLGSVKDAINVLSQGSLKIVLITDSNLKLVGTVTDGDIRRGLMRGLTLSSPISDVINQNPFVVSKKFTRDGVLKIMLTNRIFQVPVVDENVKLVGLHVWDEITAPTTLENVMVIMAGGKGTRLLPNTEKTPKPMLQLGGKPILEHIMVQAKNEGITKFILTTHHLGDVIEGYFGDGQSLGVEISYIREKTPLGTAGALRLITPKPTKPIIVTNGDVLTNSQYSYILDFHNQNQAIATMAVQVYESQNPFGVVQTTGIEITGYKEKPIVNSLINAGVYVLDPSALDLLDKYEECNMPTLFEDLKKEGLKIIAFPLHEKWMDLGSPSDLAKAMYEIQSTQRFNN